MTNFRKAKVYVNNIYAGILEEIEGGFRFSYDAFYIHTPGSLPVSLTFPLNRDVFLSDTLFPFFDGLIPEGFLLNVVKNNWKLDINDRFGLLLVSGKDPIGNVRIEEDL